jgi:hypothetical protein
MHTTPLLCGLALEQDRTWEWQWGMHLVMFMLGAGAS